MPRAGLADVQNRLVDGDYIVDFLTLPVHPFYQRSFAPITDNVYMPKGLYSLSDEQIYMFQGIDKINYRYLAFPG